MSLLLTDGLAALGGTIKPTPRREEPAAAGSSLTSCPYLATYKVVRNAGQAFASAFPRRRSHSTIIMNSNEKVMRKVATARIAGLICSRIPTHI